jgi:glutamate-1-semialdehyde 2,1-aminomutase/spore coat polysaccharide biosynthesis protein SpsF
LEEPTPGFLKGIRKLCNREGAVLIFDEVLTGFRFGLSGAQGVYGVVPDLACLGKALGNGFPISALVGRREIMALLEHEVFFSFTFGGEVVSLAAAKATLDYLKTYQVPSLLWRRGEKFITALQDLIEEWDLDDTVEIRGFPTRFVLNFRGKAALAAKTLVQQECIKRGELFTGAFNLALPHTEKVMEKTLEVFSDVFRLLRYAKEYELIPELLEGELLKEIFQVRK